MSVHRHKPRFPHRVIALLAAGVAALLALACSRGERRPHPGPPVLPPDPQTVLFVPPVAGANAGAGAGLPVRRPPPPGDGETCADPGCIPPGPIPAGARCFELRNHAPSDPATPYLVQKGEGSTCFYYDVPWAESSVLVAWQTELDAPVMHEWQLYTAAEAQPHGTAELCLGGGNRSGRYGPTQLVMAHPRGSNDVLMPRGVGLQAPAPGTRLVLQWHHLNAASAAMNDASLVRLCTLPARAVERIASLTVLGSETIPGMAALPLGRHDVEGSCPIRERNVRLLMLAPHMHALGRHVTMSVQRSNGVPQRILDLDFVYDAQLMRATDVTLRPGDRLTTRCTYNNDTAKPVHFGVSFDLEQCFVYAVAEPAGALDNAAPSALGASNTCW
jgi:hypothetical protein